MVYKSIKLTVTDGRARIYTHNNSDNNNASTDCISYCIILSCSASVRIREQRSSFFA